jgi:hypothetical protein
MPLYCYHCDEFYDYNVVKRLGSTEKCLVCGNKYHAYYNTEVIARRWAPVKARCMHCRLLGKDDCPENGDQIKPLYHKPCERFVEKKGAKYRIK